MTQPTPFAYFFEIGVGPPFFRLASDPSVPHLLANPDVYHATPLYALESDEVRREREVEAASLEERALGILERVCDADSPLDLADEAVTLGQAIEDVIAPHGSTAAILLYLRDTVHWAVHGEDGFNENDLQSTRERLEELKHPI